MIKKSHPKNKLLQKLISSFYRPIKSIKQLMNTLKEAENNLVISPNSLSFMEGAIQIDRLKVRDVMIPKSKMVMISSDSSTEELLKQMSESSHSRFPLYNKKEKRIIGIILAKDMLAHLAKNKDKEFNYKENLRNAISVPESKPLGSLLRDFQSNKSHMAVVLDEYNKIAGLVTLEDVLEQIVGDINDEHDKEEEYITDYGDNRYLLKGNTPISEFNNFFNTSIKNDNFETIAGMIITEFTYLPEQMSTISLYNFNFKILKLDSRRIQLIEVTKEQQNK